MYNDFMEDNNPQNPVNPQSNPQDNTYQDILNQYAGELNKNTIETPAPEAPPIISQPVETPHVAQLPELPTATENQISFAPNPNMTPMPHLPPQPTPTPTYSEPAVSASVSVSTQPTIFKYLFYLSLIIFLSVAGALVWTLVKLKNIKPSVPNTNIPTIQLSPTVSPDQPTSGPSCELNDKRYAPGETFPAADGCNTCTCNDSLTIDCTQKTCDTTPSP